MFETASFHLVKPCNYRCKFCYATYEDINVKMQIGIGDVTIILSKLKQAGLKKITFAGGEPLLYRGLNTAIRLAKRMGLTTSIITNGSLLTESWLDEMKPDLDWIGVSVDSLDRVTNEKIGRVGRPSVDYHKLISSIKNRGYKLKINTVVNAYNWQEDMNDFIYWANPERWKVFQALRVRGQNDAQFDEMRVSSEQYDSFVQLHTEVPYIVQENNETMGGGAYLLIDPLGRAFEDTKGEYTYSRPLQSDATVWECLSDINLNREKFLKRGGIYEW